MDERDIRNYLGRYSNYNKGFEAKKIDRKRYIKLFHLEGSAMVLTGKITMGLLAGVVSIYL